MCKISVETALFYGLSLVLGAATSGLVVSLRPIVENNDIH